MNKVTVEMVEIPICGNKHRVGYMRRSSDPKVIFTHIAGARAEQFVVEPALTEGIDACIRLH